jgi:hypothetical protein
MIVIDLLDFIKKVQDYQKSPYGQEKLYGETLGQRNVWGKLAQINEQQTRDVVLRFVNAWKCRVSYTCAPDLSKALKDSSKLLSKFDGIKLQDVDLNFLIADNNIEKIFRNIATVKAGRRRVGATATTKILHMVNPHFFPMADENTRFGYGCSDNELGYVNFMWRMKLFGDALFEEYLNRRKLPKEIAFQNLVSECKSAATTLPKLLDEYNWVKFNP